MALTSSGSLYAWGLNNTGQLGDSTTINRAIPNLVSGGFTDWSKLSAGTSHSLAIRNGGFTRGATISMVASEMEQRLNRQLRFESEA